MRRVAAVVLLAVLVAGCAESGRIGGLLVVDGRHTVAAGTSAYGDLYVLDGIVELRPTSRLTGSAFVLGGRLVVAGMIDGDVAIVGGHVVLTGTAIVAGGLRRGGGVVEQASGASVGTELVSPVAVDALLDLTRPAADGGASDVGWTMLQLLLVVLFAGVSARLAPGAVSRMGDAARRKPHVPVAVGLLGLLVGIPLVVFMVFTVVLIPVALLLVSAGALGAAAGFVSLGSLLAERLRDRTGWLRQRATVRAMAGSAALAGVVLVAVRIPVLGEVVVAAVASAALGVWLLTRFGTRTLEADTAEEPRSA